MGERISAMEFARRAGCDVKQVRRAIERGTLTRDNGGKLDAAQLTSTWRRANRRTRQRAPQVSQDNDATSTASTAASVDDALRLFEQQAAAVTERVLNGASYSDALRIKENYLALLRQLEYSIKAGAVIDLAAAEETVFELFRGVRDAWLNWPARVAPLIAADLDFEDVERLGVVLAAHVQSHLDGLGEPQTDFRRSDA
ncbi:hypothetical protein [Paraburkholderia adhaesiva]|uniref:hypothetical protein n=1 Tax=Paraburkholderia adhaesiva TaxID=2883244 RepID=UPI001F22DF4C|nr:hypothetical protein [Paraburkholderia adhaesiva]